MSRRGLALSVVVVTALLAVTALALSPSAAPLSIANAGDKGASAAFERLGATAFYDVGFLSSLRPESSFVIFVAAEPLSAPDAEALASFAEAGGLVVVLDIGDSARALGVYAGNSTIMDAVNNYGDPSLPMAFAGSDVVFLDSPRQLSADGWECALRSGPFSYADINGDGLYEVGEPLGPFCVAVSRQAGLGKILVASGPGLLENALASANLEFLAKLAGNRSVYIYQGFLRGSPVEVLKALSLGPARYAILVVDALAAGAVVAYASSRR
ncbi:MAG: DUF4350 domain-containing protein [Desulfurococcaceae archaeon]